MCSSAYPFQVCTDIYMFPNISEVYIVESRQSKKTQTFIIFQIFGMYLLDPFARSRTLGLGEPAAPSYSH